MATAKAKGGANRGQGSNPLYGAPMKLVAVRMTQAQADKLKALGGARWLRDQVDRARLMSAD